MIQLRKRRHYAIRLSGDRLHERQMICLMRGDCLFINADLENARFEKFVHFFAH